MAPPGGKAVVAVTPRARAAAAARRVLGSPLVVAPARALSRRPDLGDEAREARYHRVKRIPVDPSTTFTHAVPGGAELTLHVAGTVVRLFWTGAYEDESLLVFDAYARDAAVVLDIGAADGLYSLFAAAVNPAARLVAFEPGARQRANLAANVAANPAVVGSRLEVHDVALSDEDGTATFYGSGGTSSLNPAFRSGAPGEPVVVARGDAFLATHLPGVRVDLIKIDVESTEPAALAGLASTIERDRPVIFCEVLSGRTEDGLQALVDAWGYRTYWLSGSGPVARDRIEGDPAHRYLNWLFLPDDAPPRSA